MSHVTSQSFDLKDLGCLEKACQELGLEIRAKKTYRWFGQSVGDYPIPEGFTAEELGKCEFAIGIKGDAQAYEIGAVKKNGQWHLLFDFWGPGEKLKTMLGENLGRLKTGYNVQVVKKAGVKLTAMGYRLTTETRASGEVVMSYRKG
jgi:hypothetical protein